MTPEAAPAPPRRKARSPLTVGLIALAIVLDRASTSASRRTSRSRTASASNAVFQSANSLRVNSPVRIAGVAVGKVKAVKPKEGTDEALVTMEIKKNGLPIHEDATAKIRPRIFLEGNFFVDLQPGHRRRRRSSTTATRSRSRARRRRSSSTRC